MGTQYRSAIFFHSPEQRAVAAEVLNELGEEGVWDAPIVTEVVPFTRFYPAEDYHEDYFRRNPQQSYCQMVINPKVAKFRARFSNKLRSRKG